MSRPNFLSEPHEWQNFIHQFFIHNRYDSDLLNQLSDMRKQYTLSAHYEFNRFIIIHLIEAACQFNAENNPFLDLLYQFFDNNLHLTDFFSEILMNHHRVLAYLNESNAYVASVIRPMMCTAYHQCQIINHRIVHLRHRIVTDNQRQLQLQEELDAANRKVAELERELANANGSLAILAKCSNESVDAITQTEKPLRLREEFGTLLVQRGSFKSRISDSDNEDPASLSPKSN